MVVHNQPTVPVKAAVLNCETLIFVVPVAIQDPTPTEYKTELVPIAAIEGVNIPEPDIPPFVVQVPPPGVAIKATVGFVLQTGFATVIVGEAGLIIVAVSVFSTGQLTAVGVTTTLYTTLAIEPVIGVGVIKVTELVGDAIPGPAVQL